MRRLVLNTGGDAVGVRIVGDMPVQAWSDDWREWSRDESVTNMALGQLPLTCVCAYDGRGLPPEVRAAVSRTHPFMLATNGVTKSPDFVGPVDYLRMVDTSTSDPVEHGRPDLTLEVEDALKLATGRKPITRRWPARMPVP